VLTADRSQAAYFYMMDDMTLRPRDNRQLCVTQKQLGDNLVSAPIVLQWCADTTRDTRSWVALGE
jgi:hypothetical protein